MAFTITSKKPVHENSGFKLLWQMVCILLTAGRMLICYVHLKRFGQTTKRNATSLLWPGCHAPGQAEMVFTPKIPGKEHRWLAGRMQWAEEISFLCPEKSRKMESVPREGQGSWQLLGIPLDGGCLKLQPDRKNLMVRTAWAEVRFVYKSS